MNVGFMAILMLFSGDLVPDFLNAPPRDLAALVSPEYVLTQAGVAQDEESLIAALSAKKAPPTEAYIQQAIDDLVAEDIQVRRRAEQRLIAAGEYAMPLLAKAAESEDAKMRATALDMLTKVNDAIGRPAAKRDEEYVKKLFAIRLLEKTKSRKALPALKSVAEGDDVTLADAARQAIAAINGEKVAPPDTRRDLEDIAGKLPDNVGFAGVLDLSRNRKSRTLRETIAPLLQDPRMQPLLQAMGGPRMEEQMNRMQDEAERGIVEAISLWGNLRIDSIVMITSDNLPDRTGYVGWIFKGLCDPARLRGVLAGATREQNRYTLGEHVVFCDPGDFAVCVLDEHTVAITVTPGGDQKLPMRMVLAALDRKEKRPVPAHLTGAFDMVTKEGRVLAVSGTLSDLQKALFAIELDKELTRARERQERNPRPDGPIQIAVYQTVMNLEGVELFTAVVGEKGTVTLRATCADPKAAAVLAASLADIERALQTMIAQAAAEMPAETKAMFGLDKPDATLWLAMLDDRTLTVTVDIGAFAQRFGSMTLGVRTQRPRDAAAEAEARLAARRAAEEEKARLAAEEARRLHMEAVQKRDEVIRKQQEERERLRREAVPQ